MTAHEHFWKWEQEANLPNRQESGSRNTVSPPQNVRDPLYGLTTMLPFSFSCVNITFSPFFAQGFFYLFGSLTVNRNECVTWLMVEQDRSERPKGKRDVYKWFGHVGHVVSATCRLETDVTYKRSNGEFRGLRILLLLPSFLHPETSLRAEQLNKTRPAPLLPLFRAPFWTGALMFQRKKQQQRKYINWSH